VGLEAINLTREDANEYCINDDALLCYNGLTDRRIVAGLSLHRIRMLLAVVEEGVRVPRFQLLRDPVGEAPPSCWIERGTTGTSAAGKR
jgi:hypothetical protein